MDGFLLPHSSGAALKSTGRPVWQPLKRPLHETRECYSADNGYLEKELDRAKAHDLHWALPNCASNPNAKVLDWFDCRRIMENADIVMEHLKEFIALRDTPAP